MAIALVVNGQVFEYPQNFDEGWGIDATGWAQAVTNGMLSLSGGNFPLTAQANFGPNFGVTALNLITQTTHPASTGFLRLANADTIVFRNVANNADLALAVNGSNNLTFNGVALGLTALATNEIYVGNASNVPVAVAMSGDATIVASGALTISAGAINNSKVASGAAIAVNKLAALTPSTAIATDSSGFLVSTAITATELGYLSGVTSSVQTQINNVQQVPSGAMMDFGGTVAPTGWLLCDGSIYSTGTYPALFAAIGYAWGNVGGDFRVPNMTRRVSMGSGGSGTATIGNAVGNVGGAETATPAVSITDPGHVHSISHRHAVPVVLNTADNDIAVATAASWGQGTQSVTATFSRASSGTIGSNTIAMPMTMLPDTANSGSATTGITAASTATNIIQPSAIVLKIIKI